MRKIWILVSANLRKSRGQAVSFFFLILLAASLLNIGTVVSFHYDENFDRRARENNSADVITTIQNRAGTYIAQYEKELAEDERTAQVEVRPALFFAGSCEYGDSETTHSFAVLDAGQKQEIGKVSYIEKMKEEPERPVYLPWLFQTGGGYHLGDTFRLTVSGSSEKEFEYTVAGFFDETMLATINSTTTGLILGEDMYRELSEEFAGTLDASMFLVQMKDRSENEAYSTDHLPVPSDNSIMKDTVFYDVLKRSRTVTSSIASALIVAFSAIIVCVTLVVVKFRIGNSIEEDMPNIGAQKAIGYTSRQILISILLQFLSVGSAGIVCGIGVSYVLLPVVSDMFAAQTGIVWEQGFDPFSALITFTVILLAVALVSLISAKKIRILTPVVALRTGITTHSFKRNYFPLEKNGGNLLFRLAGKFFCQNMRQNILVGCIITAIGFASVFAGVLYYNISLKFDHFMESTVGELFSVQITCPGWQQADEVLEAVKRMPEVRKAFSSYTDYVQSREGAQIICYLTEDYSLYDNQDMIYEGRFPKHENEVAVGGLLAEKLKKKPGDPIILMREGKEAEYLITGLVQGSNYMGHDAAMTEEGYLRLAPDYKKNMLAVYLRESVDTDTFLAQLKEEQGENISVSYDYKKMVRASLGTYQGIVASLVVVIAFITAAIVILTLYLVIKTSVLRKRKEFGIQKAIGYTTGQLVLQTAVSFFPVVLAGSAAGILIGYVTINPLLSILFSGIGLMRVNYAIPAPLLAGICAAITGFGFVVSVLVAARIRKITPYMLMTE